VSCDRSADTIDARVNLSLGKPEIWLTHLLVGTLDNEVEEKIVCAIPITSTSFEDPNDCYHDSASNQHVFNRKEVFRNYRDITPVMIHGFSQGLETAALGIGDVVMEGEYDKERKTYKIKDCLYVPGAHANLISQVRLDRIGVSAWFEKGQITLYRNGKPCIDGSLKNEMYRLNFRPLPITPEEQSNNGELIVMAAKGIQNPPGFYTA
jgi:hypothetical protein